MHSAQPQSATLRACQALVEALQRCREGIGTRIREANGMTEREVLAAGESLQKIVDQTREFVLGSQKSLEEVAAASFTDMLARHRALMTDFVQAMQAQVAVQSQAAEQATNQINRIVDLGRDIQHVTMESRMLALNANIQARRLGDAGKAFQVIGQEMKQFSESVSEANKGVQALAESLLDVLPRIQRQAAQARELSEQFSKDIIARVAEVARADSEMKQRIAEDIEAGETRQRQILQLSYDALSHLQFQDPVAQMLLGCDRDVAECVQRVARWAGGATECEAELEEQPESADNMLESGEVMLL